MKIVILMFVFGFLPEVSSQSISDDMSKEILDTLRHLQEENVAMKNRIGVLEKRAANTVAFTAFLNADQEVQPDETVIFSNDDVNVGDAYNSGTGEFTCPVTGVYFFGFQFLVRNDRSLTMQLRIRETDGTNRGSSSTYYNNSHTHGAGATAVVRCAANEKVYVRNAFDSYGTVRSITEDDDQEGVWQSYFTGFLIELV